MILGFVFFYVSVIIILLMEEKKIHPRATFLAFPALVLTDDGTKYKKRGIIGKLVRERRPEIAEVPVRNVQQSHFPSVDQVREE